MRVPRKATAPGLVTGGTPNETTKPSVTPQDDAPHGVISVEGAVQRILDMRRTQGLPARVEDATALATIAAVIDQAQRGGGDRGDLHRAA